MELINFLFSVGHEGMVSTNDRNHPLFIRFSQVGFFSKESITAFEKQPLIPGHILSLDGLACLGLSRIPGTNLKVQIKYQQSR